MSIPIDPARAVGGRLAAGDRVDVLFAGERAVSIIVADAEVLAVDARGRGGIGESASPFTVTLAVNARQSQLVAAAVADGNVSLARTTGATSSKGTAPESLDRVDAGGRPAADEPSASRPSRSCSRPSGGSRSCTGTSPTTVARGCVRSSSSRRWRSTRSTTRWS